MNGPCSIFLPLRWLLVAALCAAPVAAQLEEEDLEIDETVISAEIQRYYDDAETLFQTVDQADSIPLFAHVIDALLPLAGAGEEAIDQLLRASILYRARAQHNFAENELARGDLALLISMSPDFEIDRDEVSEKLVQLFDRVRDRLVGFVEFLVEPSDAELSVAGKDFRPQQGPQAILAGSYVAEARRPGYTPTSLAFEVTAGDTRTVEAILERTSAVIGLRTRPSEATVIVDGEERGRTSGVAETDFLPTREAAAFPRSDFSARLLIADIPLGSHRVEIRKDGYRSHLGRLQVGEIRDFLLEPILLERETGTVVLMNLPPDAKVRVNGNRIRPLQSRLQLSPGSYRLSVTRGTAGTFETAFDLADRQVTEVQVTLRPALVLLGILGRDDIAAERLRDNLVSAFRRLGSWNLLDRSSEATALLQQLGLEVVALRSMSRSGDRTGAIDWPNVQGRMDETLPGSVYIVGVLSDDLVADAADLWIWPAAPGPSRPELRRLTLQDPEAMESLARAFVPSIGRVTPVLGALTIDSALADGPVVAWVQPGSPAAAAGLEAGHQITALGDVPVFSSAQLRKAIAELEAGESIELEVKNGDRTRKVSLTLGRSYNVVDLADPNVVYPALSAALAAELQRASDWPRWVLQLNQAGILLRSGDHEEAVRQLRRIDATGMPTLEQPGLGRAALEYWLGIALTQAGSRYVDLAREAFAKAATATEGRLLFDDGPFVAPRARARLERLGGTTSP